MVMGVGRGYMENLWKQTCIKGGLDISMTIVILSASWNSYGMCNAATTTTIVDPLPTGKDTWYLFFFSFVFPFFYCLTTTCVSGFIQDVIFNFILFFASPLEQLRPEYIEFNSSFVAKIPDEGFLFSHMISPPSHVPLLAFFLQKKQRHKKEPVIASPCVIVWQLSWWCPKLSEAIFFIDFVYKSGRKGWDSIKTGGENNDRVSIGF